MNNKRQQQDWDERYRTGNLPWETGRHDRNLEEMLSIFEIGPGNAFEFGCGTANNAIWLAQNGFDVHAMDISAVAVDKASAKALDLSLKIGFQTGSILSSPITGAPFKLVFDRGCFHSLDTLSERITCSGIIHGILSPNGYWLSIMGNSDGPDREVGPPRLSALNIAETVEKHFEILLLKSGLMDSDQPDPPRAWICLMRKRNITPVIA